LATTATEHPRFWHMVKPIKSYKSITNFEQQRKLCYITFLPTALPVGVFLIMPSLSGIMTLTCTIFDPNIFLIFS